MKILTEQISDYFYFHYLLNSISTIGYSINVMQDINNLNKALVEVKPDLILLRVENVTPEVLAYSDRNNAKLILFGNEIPKKYNILITKNEALTNGDNILLDKILPNPLQIQNAEYKKNLSSEISILTNDATDPVLVETLAMNYPVKIYGNKKINSPKYLGKINQEQRNNILKSSKYVIDFGTYDYLDAVLLDTYPILYTKNKTPDVMSFENLTQMIDIMDKIAYGNLDIDEDMKKLKKNINSNTTIVLTQFILKKLGMNQEAVKLGEIA